MPLYDYKCPECGYEEEVMRKYENRDSLMPCPKCKSACQRQVSGGKVQTYRLRNHGGSPDKHNLKEI